MRASSTAILLAITVGVVGCGGGSKKRAGSASKTDTNATGTTTSGIFSGVAAIPVTTSSNTGNTNSGSNTSGNPHARVADHGNPSGVEQERLELANRARRDPTAEGKRYGIDLTSYAARPPVSHNQFLAEAALAHTSDMAGRQFYGHVNPDGIGPNGRIHVTKYDCNKAYGVDPAANYSENIAAGINAFKDAKQVHEGLIVDKNVNPPKHRNIILGYSSWEKCREVGFSYLKADRSKGAQYDVYVDDEFSRTNTDKPFVMGVVYEDKNLSGEYDDGEAVADVTVTLKSWDGQTFTAKTAAAGGYCFEIFDAGEYSVEISGGKFGAAKAVALKVGNDNMKVDGVVGLGAVAK